MQCSDAAFHPRDLKLHFEYEVLERGGSSTTEVSRLTYYAQSQMEAAAELGWNPDLQPKELTSCMGIQTSCAK